MTNWPADKVERRPIEGLIPAAKNARTHSEAQVAQIAASMREWGWTNPVLVDEAGVIIAGHGRILAARSLGYDGWRFLELHEASAYAVKKGATAEWAGGRKQSTVWFIEHLKSDTGHGTQKPVECMKRPIENNSKPGDAVYDPFVGSGTTIIAAEMTGRACHAIELNPAYVDVVVERWQAFTGGAATLEATGQTFAEVDEERWQSAGKRRDSAASYDAAIEAKRKARKPSKAAA